MRRIVFQGARDHEALGALDVDLEEIDATVRGHDVVEPRGPDRDPAPRRFRAEKPPVVQPAECRGVGQHEEIDRPFQVAERDVEDLHRAVSGAQALGELGDRLERKTAPLGCAAQELAEELAVVGADVDAIRRAREDAPHHVGGLAVVDLVLHEVVWHPQPRALDDPADRRFGPGVPDCGLDGAFHGQLVRLRKCGERGGKN